MPPKPVKKTEANKQDIADKIREIKIRQQNWSKHEVENTNRGKTNLSESNVRHEDSAPKNWPGSGKIQHNITSQQQTGFKAWLERKAEISERSCSSRCDSASTALNLSSASDDNNADMEEIEAAADRIVTRVRREMKTASSGCAESAGQPPSQPSRGVGSLDTVDVADKSSSVKKSHKKHPDSHYCLVCQQLMVPPICAPILMVPCGDTVCSKCARQTDQCPLCRSVVRSRTCNIMLQQIVEQYRHEELIPSAGHSKYSAKKHMERKNNIEQYNNLQLRCEILDGEQDSIMRTIERLDRDKKSEEMQILSIEKQQQKLEDEIEELRERQQILESHKTAYIENCNEIEERKKDERRKLGLLQTTLAELHIEMKQMKLSSGDFLES